MAPKKSPSKAKAAAAEEPADVSVKGPISEKYSNLSAQENRRSAFMAIILQIGIRLRYIIESRFWVLPIFHDLAEHPSPWRPKTCPQ